MLSFDNVRSVLLASNIRQESIEDAGKQLMAAKTEEETQNIGRAVSICLRENLQLPANEAGEKVLAIFFIINELLVKSGSGMLPHFQRYLNDSLSECLNELDGSSLSNFYIGHLLKVMGIWSHRNLLNPLLIQRVTGILHSKLKNSDSKVLVKPNFDYSDLIELAEVTRQEQEWVSTRQQLLKDLSQMAHMPEDSIEKEFKKSNLKKCEEKLTEFRQKKQKAMSEAIQNDYLVLMKSLLDLKAIDDKIQVLQGMRSDK